MRASSMAWRACTRLTGETLFGRMRSVSVFLKPTARRKSVPPDIEKTFFCIAAFSRRSLRYLGSSWWARMLLRIVCNVARAT